MTRPWMEHSSAWPGISGNRGTSVLVSSFAAKRRFSRRGHMSKYKQDIFGIGTLFAISMVGLLAFGL